MDKKRILIVDDEVNLAYMLQLNLERTGNYQVRVANSGGAGLAAAAEFEPELILLDLMMPDMDGTEVADRLSADPKTSDTPVVFLTAIAQKSEVKAHGGVIGGRSFLAKPVSIKEVIRTIEERLASAGRR